MPHHKSAKKRLRQSEVLRVRNKSVRSDMRTAMKKVSAACAEGDATVAANAAHAATSIIDRAWKHGVIKKNSAARKKSSVARQVNALSASE